MSKVKSKSQKIGEAGEGLVKFWAPINMHSANKIENDFGFDFTFQQFKKHGEQEIATGAFFLAQCKSTTSENNYQYVTLDENDILLHLYSNMPVCLLGVDIDNKTVRHLFLDQNLVNKYLEFLDTENKTLNLNFNTDLKHESEFTANSTLHTQPGFSLSLRNHIINVLIQKYAPGSKLSVLTDDARTQLKLKSPYLTNIVDPKHLFNPKTRLEIDDIFNTHVLEILKQYYPDFNSIYLSGAIGTDSTISFGSKKTNTITYPHGDLVAYRMQCGLTFQFGPCEEDSNGRHIHSSNFIVSDSPFPLFNCQSDVNLFSTYDVSSSLYLDGHSMIPKLEDWDELNGLLSVLKEITSAYKISPEYFQELHISDLNEPENYYSYLLLLALVRKENRLFPEFCIDPDAPPDSLKIEIANGSIPIAFKINGHSKIANVKCAYKYVLNKNNVVVGIGIGAVTDFQVSDLNWPADLINYPEIWAFKNWPPIPMFGKLSITFKDTNSTLPFEITRDQNEQL